MRAAHGCAAALGSLLTLALPGCQTTNQGQPPPDGRFFFPSGVLLDPIDREPGPTHDELGQPDPDLDLVALPPESLDLPGPRYLYVANGNNDRSYNAGTLVAVDLRAFWRAWYDPQRDDPAQAGCSSALAPARAALDSARAQAGLTADELEALRDVVGTARVACAARDPRRGGVDPYCHAVETVDGPVERCVLPPGSATVRGDEDTPARPCRRLPLVPHVAECDETAFAVDTVRVGDFATTLAYSREGDAVRLWLPVRGDPSITYVDARVVDGELALECDQGHDPLDPELCGDSHRLDDLRNEPALGRIDREPFNVAVWERDPSSSDPDARGQRLAFVAHSSGRELTLVDLDGVRGQSRPAIVDVAGVYQTPAGSAGGYGLAVRPCFEEGKGPLGAADPEPNVPSITQGCTRPLVYTSFRYAAQLASFTASGLDLPDGAGREGCMVSSGGREVFAGQYCATPEQLDQPCAVVCEPQVRATRRIQPSLIDPFGPSAGSAPVLGAMAFADPRGDQLLVLQTNPGALLSLDTSLGDGHEPLDIPSAPPVEICAEPSNMEIYVERGPDGVPTQRYALISCFRAALVYVVDLEALRVVEAVVVGTGPHAIAIDEAREAAYVINNLESSISVIDLSRRRATRFQELARLGLQEPFSQ